MFTHATGVATFGTRRDMVGRNRIVWESANAHEQVSFNKLHARAHTHTHTTHTQV